jgi:hypothetical protein
LPSGVRAAIIEDLACSASNGSRCGGAEHFDEYRAALGKLEAMRPTFPSFESRARSRIWWAIAMSASAGRAIRTAFRFIRCGAPDEGA